MYYATSSNYCRKPILSIEKLRRMNNSFSSSSQDLHLAPVLMSLLGGNHKGMLTKIEREKALNLARIKSFSSHEDLKPFFQEVYGTFEENLIALDKTLPAGKFERKKAIINKLGTVKEILQEMPASKARKYKQAFVKFARLTSKGDSNFIEDHFAAVVELFLKKRKGQYAKYL